MRRDIVENQTGKKEEKMYKRKRVNKKENFIQKYAWELSIFFQVFLNFIRKERKCR